ncbi:MAG: hypothetical protein EPN77_19600 [Candidimonas sp.]|nr:MAG: hypothetical protein EPN77_19600 [Candidimonas sp.]
MVEIAHVRRRFGCRRIRDLLRPEFAGLNHKRVLRPYPQARLGVIVFSVEIGTLRPENALCYKHLRTPFRW